MSHTATCHLDPAHTHDGGLAHGLADPSIRRSREGVRAVSASLAILTVTAILQGAIYAATGSIALLADLIHNAGDALTALPLGAACWVGLRLLY
jgi:divalent metal cation (Fe/Co/Zn/Cd) transporter